MSIHPAQTESRPIAQASAPARVLFVQSYTGLGGAETALLNLLRNLPRDRVTARVVSLEHGNGALLNALADCGVPVERRAAGRFRNMHRAASAVRWLAQIIQRQPFDVVLANGGHPNLYARPAARLAGCPSVWWVHDHSFADPLRAGPLGFLQTLVRADVLVANSRVTEYKLRACFPGTRIETIPPGIDLACVEQALALRSRTRQALQLRDDQWVVGTFARLQRWKGHKVFLHAVARARQDGFGGQAWIVGGATTHHDPGYEQELHRVTAELGLESCVKFFGSRADALALMSATDTVVHASVRPEPYGLVVAEAMALGRPVVATAHGGPLEMISEGKDGLLVPPGDPAALAEALLRLWRNPVLCQRLGEQARMRAHREFSASRTAELFCRLFDQLAGKLPAVRSFEESPA